MSNVTWQLFSDDLVIEQLGDNAFALFNPSFSDSTVLNAVDECVLRLLAEHRHGMDFTLLVQRVSQRLDLDVDSNLQQYLAESLDQMKSMGIVKSEGTNAV